MGIFAIYWFLLEKAFNFSQIMLAVAFLTLGNFPSITVLMRVFIKEDGLYWMFSHHSR